ncbi:hypothetical protein EV196_102421 [Mariniflexile fucanivorans]|uniref:Uncharacterized protein n=1 Tax=Mariniflexile fucanivorans TaxID=264023 RepID=A0A4R1RNH5_9FLAO|nr:hypothetical protein [Mariniflexile fucanivorans]TCL67858.1 hypothetical protein EV196_102421 [Mariniflexile fucanivorans]
MTIIKIKKHTRFISRIIVLIMILGILSYFFYACHKKFSNFNNNGAIPQQYDTVNLQNNEIVLLKPDSIIDRIALLDEYTKDSMQILLDSTYAKKAYINLVGVIVKTADDYNIKKSKSLMFLRNYTDNSINPYKIRTQDFKPICDNTVQVLEVIQQKKFPLLDRKMNQLKYISSQVNSATNFNKQKHLLLFLEKTKDILYLMYK